MLGDNRSTLFPGKQDTEAADSDEEMSEEAIIIRKAKEEQTREALLFFMKLLFVITGLMCAVDAILIIGKFREQVILFLPMHVGFMYASYVFHMWSQ